MAIGENRRTVFELYKIEPDDVRRSREWFDQQIKRLSTKKITPNRVMQEEGWHLTSNLVPGKMYFYYYDAKGKDTLPYWDQFPLVIPYGKTEGGFIGLNMHYLEYRPRMILLQEMLKISGNRALTPMSKIDYSWGLIKGAAKMKMAAPCIKNYLIDHVMSPFCEIPPEFWHTAMMLPVQRFVGQKKEYVWKESNKRR